MMPPFRYRSVRLVLVALAQACALAAAAQGFSVAPMRVDLEPGARSAALTLRNDDNSAKSFSVQARRWRQDEQGQESYDEAPDLIHFPRLLTVEAGQEAVVRLGLRQPQAEVERAWRLFIEEMPPPRPAAAPQGQGAQVRVLVRFGVPVFAKPAQSLRRLNLESFVVDGPRVRWLLHNQGNQHEAFQEVILRGEDAAGAEVFSQSVSARYLLAGSRRTFDVELPVAPACERLAQLELRIRTDQDEIRRRLPLPAGACP